MCASDLPHHESDAERDLDADSKLEADSLVELENEFSSGKF